MIPHTVDSKFVFRFEFGPAVLAQVLSMLEGIEPVALDGIPSETRRYPGFYQLLRGGQSVYVGRTVRPIANRIAEHAAKLRGRVPLEEMAVRYVFVEDLSLVGISEDVLISYFAPLDLDPWGKTGFGSKAPGSRRGEQRSKWHEDFPPDLKFPVTITGFRNGTLRRLIHLVSKHGPIRISVLNRSDFDADHPALAEDVDGTRPFTEWVAFVENRLASGWVVDRQPMTWFVRQRR